MRILRGLPLLLLVAGLGAADVRADDVPRLNALKLAEICAPATRPTLCREYVQGLVDAQLELHAQGKLSAPILCGYAIDGTLLDDLSKAMLKRGVDPGTAFHDAQFAGSPAAAFVYAFLAEKFPCPAC